MKKLFIIGMTFFSLSAFAKKQEFTEYKFFKCSRSIINTEKVDLQSMNELYSLFKSFTKPASQSLLDACLDLKEKVENNTQTFSDEEMLGFVDSIVPLTDSEGTLLKHLIQPEMWCTVNGVQVEGAAVAGALVGVYAGRCESTDGRIWGVITPIVGWKLGLGAALTLNQYNYWLKDKQVLEKLDNKNMLGLIVAMKLESISDMGGADGWGVGIGGTHGTEYALNVKAVQLGNDFKQFMDYLHH